MIAANTLAYIAALFVLLLWTRERPLVAAMLALNWLVCEILKGANGGYMPSYSFMLVDFLTCAALIATAERRSDWAAIVFYPFMILNNGTIQNELLLNAMAWGQILAVAIWGNLNDIRKLRRHIALRNFIAFNRETEKE